MSQLIPLQMLRTDEQAWVFDLEGPAEAVHRLIEMGLRPGQAIRMLRPGRPMILAVNHQRLSLRVDDGVEILVSLEPVSATASSC